MVGSRASPQGLLVFPPGAAEQNWRPCPQVVCEGSAQPLWGLARLRLGLAAAWPYPPSGTLVFCPRPIHTRMATELALDCHHPQHRRAPYALPPVAWGGCSGERRADTATRSRRMCVPSRLSPVPLCPVCTQMSMNAVRRMGGATKYATTSQAASTAPATAATSSPGTAGAAKVRLRPTEVFPASLLFSCALLAAPPLSHFCNCQAAQVGSHVGSSARVCWQWLLLWFWKGGQEGGGFLQEHMPGHAGSPGELPSTISAAHRQDDSLCL